jgi:hypothetical protein
MKLGSQREVSINFIQELLKTSYANTVHYVLKVKDIVYNFDKNQYEDTKTGKIYDDSEINSLGQDSLDDIRLQAERELKAAYPELPAADIRRLAKSPVFGSRTVKRAILFHSPSRQGRPISRKEWTELLGRVRAELHTTTSVANKLLYSLQTDPA